MAATVLLARLTTAALVLVSAVLAGAAELPTVSHQGRAYVALDRVATSLGTRLDATPGSIQAYLRTPGHVVTFTRNWAHVVVDGAPVVLDAPVRVKAGVWLVPQAFVERVLPRLTSVQPAALPRAATARPQLEDLRLRSYPSFTRVVVETSSPLPYRAEPGTAREARIRLVGLTGEARTEEVGDGLVSEIRLERAGADALLRVVFEDAPTAPRVTALTDPHRLVLDFRRAGEDVERGGAPAATPLRVIVLDAGHGGHDAGATGPSGLMEKDLVLDVTRRVARLVEEQLGVKVVLSRDGDHFVPLRDRTSFANRERADLFVSIHANAHRQTDSAGVETYFLSSEATDNAARQVAASENSVVQLETPTARGRADVVKAILWDLAQSEFQAESSRLAEIVLDSMTQSLRIPNRGVKQAGFYVLGGAAMPAILVEIGFVTNPREERRLKDSRYRDEIARAILAGLGEYKRHWDQRMRAAVERGR
jgi:N-acetylmuramoyl-L-alanine amidase